MSVEKTCNNCLYSKIGRENKLFCKEHFVEVESEALCSKWCGFIVYKENDEVKE
jgi:hypothetical protein